MERLSFRGLVNPCVRIVRIGADVADVTKNMARCILGSRRSEMRAYAAKDRGGEFLAIVRDRKTADDLETNAIDQFLLELLKMGTEAGKRKAFSGNPSYFISGGEI